MGRTPYDVQITLDAQETTRFKQHPPSLRAQGKNGNPTRRRGHGAPSVVVLRSVLQNCRGVPFKGPRSLGGSRLKGPSKDRGVQGGRGEGGKVNLPPYRCLIHAEGRRIHTFFDASFWTSFFDILARLDAKTADFGTPLAPSWAPNDAQNRPSGAKSRKIELAGRLILPPQFPRSFSERSLAPFWSIWDGFFMIPN